MPAANTSLPGPSFCPPSPNPNRASVSLGAPPARPEFYISSAEGESDPFIVDPFHHDGDRTSVDLEAGIPDPVPGLTTTQTSRRGIYAAFRRWFFRPPRGSQSSPLEKDADATAGAATYQPSRAERRLQTCSWIAMVLLLLLAIYFLMREK